MEVKENGTHGRRGWICAAVCMLFVSAGSLAFSETIEFGLDDAISYGLKHSSGIWVQELAHRASQKDLKAARAGYYPGISASADYSHRFTEAGTGLSYAHPDRVGMSLDLSQTIYSFGRLNSSVEAAKKNVMLSESELDEAKRSLSVEIQRAFYGYLLAREVLAVKEETYRYKEEARSVAQTRYDAGLTTRREVLQAESDLMGFVPELLSAKNDVGYAVLSLKNILGIESADDVVIRGELDLPDTVFDRHTLVETALDKNSSITQYEIRVALQEVTERLAKQQQLPSISGFVNLSLDNGFDIGRGDVMSGEWDTSVSAGIRVGMDFSSLFPWSAGTADIEKSGIEREKLSTELGRMRDSVTLQLESVLLDLDEGRAKIEAGEKALELSGELFLTSREMYQNGLITALEYDDAQITLKDSKVSRLTYIYDYRMSLCDLMDAIGAARI
jgi:outer membrane protein